MSRGRGGDWGADYIEPCFVPGPDEAHVLMGAQVGWSPGREARADDASGRCPLCRSTDELDGDVAEGTDFVCAKCQRWGRDGRLAAEMLRDLTNRGTLEPVLDLAPPELSPAERERSRAELAGRPPAVYRASGGTLERA